MGQNPLIY